MTTRQRILGHELNAHSSGHRTRRDGGCVTAKAGVSSATQLNAGGRAIRRIRQAEDSLHEIDV